MIRRTIEISREPAHISVRHKQLLIKHGDELRGQIPCEDIGLVVVDHPQTTYSHAALVELAESDAAVVVCGRNHLPVGMLLPFVDHSQVVWRLNDQLSVRRPLQKRLWKQLIQAKVRGQAANLPPDAPARSKLLDLARQVRSGDPRNIEAQAAKIYWVNWLPNESFRRDADAQGLNSLLNYGYAIVRAAVARAIIAAGLLPSLGIHHRHRGNPFCLADDLMEPLRPLADFEARELYRAGYDSLSPEAKAGLLRMLASNVELEGETGPLMVALHRMAASLANCYRGEASRLRIPRATAPTNESAAPQKQRSAARRLDKPTVDPQD